MHIQQGYVFIMHQLVGDMSIQHLFGPGENKGEIYSNVQINRLKFFSTKKAAEAARRAYQKRMRKSLPHLKTSLAYIWLKIGDSVEEVEKYFVKSRDLVVIAGDNNKPDETGVGLFLHGECYIKGKFGGWPIPGEKMCLTGYRVIRSFERARYIASELRRQGQYPFVKIARFRLTRLGK